MFVVSGSGATVAEAAQAAHEQWKAHEAGLIAAAQTSEEGEQLRSVFSSVPALAYNPDEQRWGCVIAITYDKEALDFTPRPYWKTSS
jgi:hypothetical protein